MFQVLTEMVRSNYECTVKAKRGKRREIDFIFSNKSFRQTGTTSDREWVSDHLLLEAFHQIVRLRTRGAVVPDRRSAEMVSKKLLSMKSVHIDMVREAKRTVRSNGRKFKKRIRGTQVSYKSVDVVKRAIKSGLF